jgi:hypothetical protein
MWMRVAGNVRQQKLERHETMQPNVLGPVDDAHAAAPNLFADAVVRDGSAD